MKEVDESCRECAFFKASGHSREEGTCRLRRVRILDSAWTVCASFAAPGTPAAALPSEASGPIYVDAGAFPDHLQPVHDWDAYLERERRKKAL